MRRNAIGLVLAMVVSTGGASSALADTITVNPNWWGNGLKVDTTGLPVADGTYAGGLMSLAKVGGTTTRTFTQTPTGGGFGTVGIASYCIDLLQHIYNNDSNTYEIVSLETAPKVSLADSGMGAVKAAAIAKLWRQYVNPTPDSPLSSAQSANFLPVQLAIWEVVYETSGTFDLTAGAFKRGDTGGVYDTAKGMIEWLYTPEGLIAPQANLLALSAPNPSALSGFQDQVVEVPEAANVISLAAIALVAGVFNLKRLRRRQEMET